MRRRDFVTFLGSAMAWVAVARAQKSQRVVGVLGSALVAIADPFFIARREQVVALAARCAKPVIYPVRWFPEAGGLMSYGPAVWGFYRQLGTYAGRILKGANVVDLPIEQNTKYELVINLKAAKALSLSVSPSLLARADEVIE
jgi:putative ABC transport system substrate-binding protein